MKLVKRIQVLARFLNEVCV